MQEGRVLLLGSASTILHQQRALRICTNNWYLYICFLVCLVLRRAAIFFGHLGSNRVSACTFCIDCGDRLGAIGGARLSLHDPGPYQCHGETWWNRKQTTTHPNRKQNKEGSIWPQIDFSRSLLSSLKAPKEMSNVLETRFQISKEMSNMWKIYCSRMLAEAMLEW